MSFLSDLMSGGIGDIVKGVKDVVDEFHTSDEEKAGIMERVEAAVTARMQVVSDQVQARFKMVQGVIEAEMKNGNGFTKAARPSIVYTGLGIHLINALGQMFGMEPIEIDENFTYVWGGVCGVWIVGRSYEKGGNSNKASQIITGNMREL